MVQNAGSKDIRVKTTRPVASEGGYHSGSPGEESGLSVYMEDRKDTARRIRATYMQGVKPAGGHMLPCAWPRVRTL